MPELPEVETTLRGLIPHIKHQKIKTIVVRQPKLRWPIPTGIQQLLFNQTILDIERRGKYLLFKTHAGTLIIHLGMSGSLRIITTHLPPAKHDHVDIEFTNHVIMRYTDPRRFGAILWAPGDINAHPLINKLGLEPLLSTFSGRYLWQQAQQRKIAIKALIMENKTVVGVGNIYATEALFAAKIHPSTPANFLSEKQATRLVRAIKLILKDAIEQGGTTLKDFVNSEGKPGYFFLKLKVYGRKNLPCVHCREPLQALSIGQRTTTYCARCQPINP